MNLDGNQYLNILQELLEPMNEQLVIHHAGWWWFMQDGACAHRSLKACKWLKEHELDVFDWPPYSPDLNPIKELWLQLKYALYHKYPTLSNKNQLWAHLQVTWANIAPGLQQPC